MPLPPEIEAARAQVFELIGRNVLRFQGIELVLKAVVANSRISITDGESPTAYERRVQATNKKTMGLLAGRFFDDAISNQTPSDEPAVFPEEAKAVADGKFHIGISHKLHLPPDVHAQWKARLQKLIEERNELVHTSLLRMNLETLEGCQQALASLEEQSARVLFEIDHLKPLVRALTESKHAMRTHLADDAFWKHIFPPTA